MSKSYAISTDGDSVSPHFGRCPTYSVVKVENGKVIERMELQNPGHRTGFIPKYLSEKGIDVIISGGMGHRAIGFFQEFGIETVLGVQGKVEDIVDMIIKGSLKSGDSLCSPGGGKDYGLPKEDGHNH